MSYEHIINNYINKDDSIRHNSNLIYSLPGLNSAISGAVSKDYWFDHVYGEEIKTLHNEGWIYVHNLDILGPYCSGYSATDIALKGLNSTSPNALKTNPPKNIHSLLGQCVNFISLISQEIHGACAVNDITSVVASYVYVTRELLKETITFKEIRNAWQRFIYEVNLAFRAGNSSFSNITMSIGGPDTSIADDVVIFGGIKLEKGAILNDIVLEKTIRYKDIPKEYYDEINKAYIDEFKLGDALSKPFTFPLLSINIDDNFDFDNEQFEYLLDVCDSWGGIYVENYLTKPYAEDSKYKKLNKYIKVKSEGKQKSFCCRFQISLEEIKAMKNKLSENDDFIKSIEEDKKTEIQETLLNGSGSIFRSKSGAGGVGVFNINLNRIGYVSQGDWSIYYAILDYLLVKCAEAAMKKRQFILNNKELYPYFFFYNENLDSYYNVISTCGGHESLINMGIKKGLISNSGIMAACSIAEHIREKLSKFSIEYLQLFSLEYAPAESASPKLAKKDLEFVEFLKEYDKTKINNKYKMFWDIIKFKYDNGEYFEKELE